MDIVTQAFIERKLKELNLVLERIANALEVIADTIEPDASAKENPQG